MTIDSMRFLLQSRCLLRDDYRPYLGGGTTTGKFLWSRGVAAHEKVLVIGCYPGKRIPNGIWMPEYELPWGNRWRWEESLTVALIVMSPIARATPPDRGR